LTFLSGDLTDSAALGCAADAERADGLHRGDRSPSLAMAIPSNQSGCAIHLYAANRSMTRRAFYDADANCCWCRSRDV
jgi:hypothetical protein